MMQNVKVIFVMMFKDCMKYLDGYFYTSLLIGVTSAFLYFMVLVCRNFCIGNLSKNNIIRNGRKIPLIALLGFYCHLVLSITVFSREKGRKYILHLVPFSTWGTDSRHLTLWIENILLLMPLGILLYILWRPFRKLGWSMLIGFWFSMTIECIQLFARLGKFELDDIVNNIFGMLIGFLGCKGIDRLLFNTRN